MFNAFRVIFSIIMCSILFNNSKVFAEIINRFEVEKYGDVIWEVPSKKKQVAITFDDGPDPVYTSQILDVLKKEEVHATFFLIGKRVKKYPEIVKRELREGHEIGNHTYNHPSFHTISRHKVVDETRKTEHLLDPAHHTDYIKLFRPPGGTVTEKNLKVLKKEGYKIILWSWHQDPRDWTNPGAQRIASHILTNVKNGDIILLHDSGGNRSQTVLALKIILPKLKKMGYEIVTVDELLKMHPRYNEFHETKMEKKEEILP
ncbi:polysaccharide deacetylase family protein [Fictibacillus phosphorivorans]|uniref:polysaccharide deacetylase family protein n=1 Tax=Fictibacillus phosphorivorans TaxID=1221500 RepID=UPI0009EF5AB5|nr:polysaccharide deacetylase family protein [Fictibacillus phosphorivorans]